MSTAIERAVVRDLMRLGRGAETRRVLRHYRDGFLSKAEFREYLRDHIGLPDRKIRRAVKLWGKGRGRPLVSAPPMSILSMLVAPDVVADETLPTMDEFIAEDGASS